MARNGLLTSAFGKKRTPDEAASRLELLRELAPGRRRLAILVNVGYPAAREELAQVQTAARALGLESAVLEMRRAEDIAPAFDGVKGRADALCMSLAKL